MGPLLQDCGQLCKSCQLYEINRFIEASCLSAAPELDDIIPLEVEQKFPVRMLPFPVSHDNEAKKVAMVFSAGNIWLTATLSQRYIKHLYDFVSHEQYGLPLSRHTPFQMTARCVFPGHESTLVDSLVEAAVPCQGSSPIKAVDLVSQEDVGQYQKRTTL